MKILIFLVLVYLSKGEFKGKNILKKNEDGKNIFSTRIVLINVIDFIFNLPLRSVAAHALLL